MLEEMQGKLYQGKIVCMWKIENYRQRRQQAITGKVTALRSAPCFTEQYGHKFCARLYLNGYGIGRNTHMTLFFVVMKSEYDALLEWPFKRRVTFQLLNLDDTSLNFKETFLPDPSSSSFRKPTRS